MASTQPSAIRKAWYRWKSLKLPWRKRFLVGLDLQGNTYWEFKDAITANRMRRIVQYPPATHHSDLKITPQWHQWLRHTRGNPPSLTEQSLDLVRLEQLKVLAARADQRWAAKESYLDQPEETKPVDELRSVEAGVINGVQNVAGESETGSKRTVQETSKMEKRKGVKDPPEMKDLWKVARGGPSEEWQPAAWGGAVAPHKR